jgi:hypothetical protein
MHSAAKYLLIGFWPVVLATSCQHPRESTLLASELDDGTRVRSLVHKKGTSILVAFAPSHCFTCDKSLTEFLTERPPAGIHVLLLATNRPSSGERLMLKMRRIAISGVLRSAPPETLLVEVFRSGSRVASIRNPSSTKVRGILTEQISTE